MDTATLPEPNVIRERMTSCQQELAALRKLLRLTLAAQQADEARRRREANPLPLAPLAAQQGGSARAS
jgi:hypothetical protein